MINKDKVYRTRDGREVRIYAVDGGANGNAIHGAYKGELGWVSDQWFPDGLYCNGGKHRKDLIEVRPRIVREVWVNVYRHPDGDEFVEVAFNKDELDAVGDARIACVKLVIDCAEGEGL